ncbi:MAG: diguanylate cyclase [Myxococcales bacterium]|nr:diguanylate cyclase [Myxococcales bacterium]MCB9519794.1 diguanylate cyclase [Myxococcales bacterium]
MSAKPDATPLPPAILEFQRRLRDLQDALRERTVLPPGILAVDDEEDRWLSRDSAIVFVHDLRGRVTRANPAACAAFGFAADTEMAGIEVRHILPPEYLPRLAEHASDQVDRGTPFPFEVCANGPSGPLWLEVNPRVRTRDGVIEAIEVIGRDITPRREAEEAARRDALHDPLTGLPNRRLFMDRLQQAIVQAERSRSSVAVLFLDLDRFKLINDGLGHVVGDDVLRGVASRIASVVRDADTVSRRGGDEFTVLLPSVDGPDAAAGLARRILDALEVALPVDRQAVHIGGSIGIALSPQDGTDAESLVHAADVAMYRAKSDGRGCYRFYHDGMNTHAREHLDIELALRQALRTEQLRLEFQPRFDARSGRIVAFEALLRVPGLDGEDLPATDVIRVAEDTGLIGAVGRWVIDRVCDVLGAADAPGATPIVVNVTERECLYGDLTTIVRDALTLHGVAPTSLELDLCHGFAANEDAAARRVMAELDALGVRLGLDEFGTARTSLRTLRVPFLSSLTIAREYVADVLDDERVQALTRGLIDLAHSLDLAAVAVGIETPEQSDWLRDAGCDVLQGVGCAIPVGEDELRRFFAQS